MFSPEHWVGLPVQFLSALYFFALGGVVGSFLNVCIHRMPRGESLILPGSHCPHCNHPIPWHLNIPLVSWAQLRGRCRFCGAPISPRYVLVELVVAGLYLGCWLAYGGQSVPLTLVYCLFLSGLVGATFIDWEHLYIPDAITLGGIGAGVLCSFLVPELHRVKSTVDSLRQCAFGAVLGGGCIYVVLRLGKLLLGRQRFTLPAGSRVLFLETRMRLPAQEILYEERFYRKSDAILLHAHQVEMVDRCYWNVAVRLTQETLQIGEDEFKTEAVPCLEVVTNQVTVPREAMGLGDVKFMTAVGAFLGWSGVLFCLSASAAVGAVVGLSLILLHRRERSSPIPYGPYIALAATVWVFVGDRLFRWWLWWLGP